MPEAQSAPTGWLTFAAGCASQREGLGLAASHVQDRLAGGAADRLRGRSLLLAGIGASHAATATPVFALRQAGVAAYRTSCGDLPAGGVAQLADYVIGVSQSGRSRETLETLLQLPQERRVAVVNRPQSPLADVSDLVLDLGDLRDSRMSSLGFTATVLGLGMLADQLIDGAPHGGWAGLGQLCEDEVTKADDVLAGFASDIAKAGMVDVVAEAASLTAAEQAALLFREGPFLPATAMDTRSYLHGPMDCAGPTSHVLFGSEREALLAEQLGEKQAPVLLVTDSAVTAPATVVRIPSLPPCQRAVLQVALAQRLVVHVARELDRDVDATAFVRLDTKVDSPADVAVR